MTANSGLAFGETRSGSLEYLVADALAQWSDTLVTIGGVQSTTQARLPPPPRPRAQGVPGPGERVDWPDPLYDRVGNIQLSRILGAHVELHPAGFSIGIHESWQQALRDRERRRRGKPYADAGRRVGSPAGWTRLRRGFAEELARQEEELGVFFDHIIVCSVTGGTQGGMVAGFTGAVAAAKGRRDRRQREA
jgi:1-aminocyclopropane-1-carboxylate deaminase